METKDWVFLVINLIGLYLVGKQTRLQARAMNPGPVPASSRLTSIFKRFWPMAIMVLLLAGTWVPYFLGKVASTPLNEPPVTLTGWVLETAVGSPVATRTFAIVGGTQFAPKYADKYNVLILNRVVGDTIDANFDRVIDRSNPFQIPVGGGVKIDVPFGAPATARLNMPRMVSTYLAIIPKNVDPSEITTLNGISGHGGYILAMGVNNWPGPASR